MKIKYRSISDEIMIHQETADLNCRTIKYITLTRREAELLNRELEPHGPKITAQPEGGFIGIFTGVKLQVEPCHCQRTHHSGQSLDGGYTCRICGKEW